MRVPTVLIEGPGGPVMIDQTEYNPDVHTLVNEPIAPPVQTQPQPVIPQGEGLKQDGPTVAQFVTAGYDPSNYPPAGYASRSTPDEIAAAIAAKQTPPATTEALVANIGDRFYIVDKSGAKLSGKGISPTGYASNDKAWEAVQKLGKDDE